MGPALASDDVPISDEARQHFQVGVNLLQDPGGARYEEAYRSFKAAYAASPSYKILGNLGLCAMNLERDGEAIEAYEQYLAKADDLDAAERKQIETDLQTLKSSVTRLTLKITPPGATVVDQRTPVKGAPVINRYGPVEGDLAIGVRPGQHRMTVQLEGYEDAIVELDVPVGGTMERAVELVPVGSGEPVAPIGAIPPPPVGGSEAPDELERPVPVSVWIGLAATGVLAIGAGVTGGLALGKQSDFEAQNTGSDPAAAEDTRSSGQTLNVVTDVLIGSAVVAGGVTLVLFLTRPEVPKTSDAGGLFVAGTEVVPSAGLDGGALTLRRTF